VKCDKRFANHHLTAILVFSFTMRGMQSIQTNNRKLQSGNLCLVGMMGAGKTTVGKLLAQHLGKTFVDSDEEIQQRTGVSITHIFDIEGEVGFRQREASAIQDLVRRDNIVLATGGGAVLSELSREALRDNSIVVYLKSTVHDLWLRTRHDRNRPLLQTADPRAKLKELYDFRDPLYMQVADLVMPTGKQNVHGLVSLLQQELRRLQQSL
jgi:shikimate kinase